MEKGLQQRGVGNKVILENEAWNTLQNVENTAGTIKEARWYRHRGDLGPALHPRAEVRPRRRHPRLRLRRRDRVGTTLPTQPESDPVNRRTDPNPRHGQGCP